MSKKNIIEHCPNCGRGCRESEWWCKKCHDEDWGRITSTERKLERALKALRKILRLSDDEIEQGLFYDHAKNSHPRHIARTAIREIEEER